MKSEYDSSSLKKVVTTADGLEKTEYVDDEGNLKIAADVGYAYKTVTKYNHYEVEEYFDDQHNPISMYKGYYALKRDFNVNGETVRITYLDSEKEPVMISQGYAIEERNINDNGQIIAVSYKDTYNKPVCTPSFSYGHLNEYDDNGRISKMTYVDENGNPIITHLGYASIVLTFYETEGIEKGRVKNEFYYDEKGNPISLSLGEYGILKKHNEKGQVSEITYLDADGKPIVNNKGYTSVKRTYYSDNSVAAEYYYGMDGKPCALSEGQYGIKNVEGKTIYLTSKDTERFNIKNLLYNNFLLVILFACLGVIISFACNKKGNIILMVLYIGVIFYFTLMNRESGAVRINIMPFWSYKRILYDNEIRIDIIRNIWLFIPFGAILYRVFTRRTAIFFIFAISILIELSQLLTRTGLCEIDDVISNGIGGLIGCFIIGQLDGFRDTIRKTIQKSET